ncbi:hypothetical protein EYZ11_012536 [Aspergillus tanneri]|uniref:Uncharacterized protein n=1 Tax=Aspergillus tanneri TaxID=1220188 RepID=A0A4S3J244_9EURO|nr:hypothetical protein EYZ11_012536 [Aspergillus tanneri]
MDCNPKLEPSPLRMDEGLVGTVHEKLGGILSEISYPL